MRARLTVLIAVFMLFLGNGAIKTDSYAPTLLLIEDQIESSEGAMAMKAREAELWNMIVQKVADDLLIPDDLELAERITHAIENSATEFDVNPWLIVALIRVESAGNPDAISRVGARGLTQVMPATGREIAKDLGIKWEGEQMLHNVETSVRFGTYYLSKLILQFEGNLHAAVAAYNWGPKNIAKRLKRGTPLPVQYPGNVLKHAKLTQNWASS